MENSESNRLFDVKDRPFGLAPDTLRAWAKSGRLRAFRAERNRLVFWESDLKVAIEAQPFKPMPKVRRAETEEDALDAALRSGELVRGQVLEDDF